ncbi:MAG: hypothetical protein O2960_17855 [Verrucomicrobia bacterium]|nr:hypothetical protein [Verrucomicrobiota bacterium]
MLVATNCIGTIFGYNEVAVLDETIPAERVETPDRLDECRLSHFAAGSPSILFALNPDFAIVAGTLRERKLEIRAAL